VSKICLLSLLPLCCLVSPRRYRPVSRRYCPVFRLIISPSSLVSGSRTHSTIYLVQHSYPTVLDSDPWSAPPRNEQVTGYLYSLETHSLLFFLFQMVLPLFLVTRSRPLIVYLIHHSHARHSFIIRAHDCVVFVS